MERGKAVTEMFRKCPLCGGKVVKVKNGKVSFTYKELGMKPPSKEIV